MEQIKSWEPPYGLSPEQYRFAQSLFRIMSSHNDMGARIAEAIKEYDSFRDRQIRYMQDALTDAVNCYPSSIVLEIPKDV